MAFYKVKFDYNSNQTGAMAYFFTFPIKNAAMKFFAETTGGSTNYLGANLVDDINLGDSYLIGYDVTSEETEWYDMTPSRSTRSADNFIELVREQCSPSSIQLRRRYYNDRIIHFLNEILLSYSNSYTYLLWLFLR